jgi:hypothetical protein
LSIGIWPSKRLHESVDKGFLEMKTGERCCIRIQEDLMQQSKGIPANLCNPCLELEIFSRLVAGVTSHADVEKELLEGHVVVNSS